MTKREQLYSDKLGQMIKYETVSIFDVVQKQKFEGFHELLQKLFPLVFKTFEFKDFEGSILLKWKAKNPKGDPVLYMSHQDVVEAKGDWKYPPFCGEVHDGAIWGRGTVDTKGSLFCIFQCFEELIKEGYVPTTDLYIASSCGEEVIGKGAATIVEYLKEQGVHLRFLLDEGGMIIEEPLPGAKGKFAMIGCLEKGTGNYKFIAKSKGGHASAPSKNTPLVRLGKFMAEIEDHNPSISKMNDTTAEMFTRVGKNAKGTMGFVMRHARGLSPLLSYIIPKTNPVGGAMFRSTIAFTTAKGADGLNVLPQEAYVTANVRFIHHQGPSEMTKVFKEIAKKYDIEVELIQASEPCPIVDYKSEPFKLVEESVKEHFKNVSPTPYAMTGGTDARFYSPICENAIRFAPLEINQQQFKSIHGLDENINVDTLPPGVDFYKAIIKKL